MDESGIHDGSPVLSVAAYMAPPTKWQKFTKEWRRTLKPTGIDIFHATDCASLRGGFKGWLEADRNKLVAKLLPIIPRHAFGYAVVVNLSEAEKALKDRPDLRPYNRDAYGACFQWVVASILEHLGRLKDPRPLAFVHEINDYQERAMQAFKYMQNIHPLGRLLMSLTFGAKAEFVPLQAADTLAWESARRINYQDGPVRRSLGALYADGRIWMRSFNRDNISKYIEMLEALKEAHEAGILSDGWRFER